MDKIIKDQFRMSGKDRAVRLAALLLSLALSVFIFFRLYTEVRNIVREQAVKSITNISQLNEDSVSRSIVNRCRLLELISDRVGRRKIEDKSLILRELEDFCKYYDFASMGVIDKSGTIYLTNGQEMDVSGNPLYDTVWNGELHLTASYIPSDTDAFALNTFIAPIYFGEEMRYLLVANYRSSYLTERMNLNSMEGKGYNFIVNSAGKVAVFPQHYEGEAYNALMRYINDNPIIVPNESSDSSFEYNGAEYYAHFEALEMNGWYLMTCAKESDVFADANRIILLVLVGTGLLWLMIIGAIVVTMVSIRRSKNELRETVFYDEMTGLGNSNMMPVFFDSLSDEEKSELALFLFDIDKFKEFNYIYGEVSGDNLLKYIVRIFKETLPDEYLFRYLDDRFAALIHCKNKEECRCKISGLLGAFAADIDAGKIQPFDISGGVRRVHARDSLRRSVSDALIAKGTVKGIHLQQVAFYDESILHKKMTYMEMESDFSRALRDEEFKVYYQPKYDIKSGRIIGAEALVRWVKEGGIVISPGAFIPCFEASRQIILLDEAMLRAVCRQAVSMSAAGIDVRTVSVNLSRVHLRHPGILTKIANIIKETGVDTAKLSFEITESALYEDSIPLKTIVDFLHSLGCRVEMDDYGVGVSGPRALAENRFDVIKLDKSFIDGIGDERTEAVIRSTISLSKILGMEILAEGVEHDYQVKKLSEWGCSLAQGFYYSPPVPENKYVQMLAGEQDI